MGAVNYNENKHYIEYATVYSGGAYSIFQEEGDAAYNGLAMRNSALVWALCLVLGVFPFYGFGVLMKNAEKQTMLLNQLLAQQKLGLEKLELPARTDKKEAHARDLRVCVSLSVCIRRFTAPDRPVGSRRAAVLR